jgi:uncharacterized iron-regulated protein
MKLVTLLLSLLLCYTAQAQELPTYKVFTKDGQPADFGQIVKEALQADVILFGELHNNAIVHWLQLKLSQALIEQRPNLVFGAEMFEADNQLILDEFLSGSITQAQMETEAKMWNNFKTDYKPLIDLAKKHNRPFIATNIPRRYASMVNRGGLDALQSIDERGKEFIAPLPFDVDLSLPGYKWMVETMGAHGQGNPNNIALAQASKDATMAHFILQNMQGGQGFIHYHGTFHSNNFEGIYWYLNKANPSLKILTIASAEQSQIDNLDEKNLNLANYILLLPLDSPKTY